MKGLKKLLALALAIAMTVSVLAAAPLSAAGAGALSNGEKLELLGLLKGDGGGVTAAYLAKNSTRMQLAILNARWLGFEQEAYNFDDWDEYTNFADYDDGTSLREWNMLAFYNSNEDLGFVGVGLNVFAPQDNITNKQFAKIILVAMGFPYGEKYNWDNILQFAGGVGIPLGNREVGINNGGMADAMVAALESLTAHTGDDGEKLTFAQYLLELGVVTEKALVDAEIAYKTEDEAPPPPPDDVELPTLAVVSAKADSFTEVEFTFNQKVAASSVTAAVAKIDNLSMSSGAKIYVAEDSGDKIVRVYEPAGFVSVQNDYRTISLTGLKTPGGISMNAYSQQITFRDTTAPSIDKVVAKGKSRLDIYFTEPLVASAQVKTLSNYQIAGRAIGASAPTLNEDADVNAGRIVTIKNITTQLTPGFYALGVLGANMKDLAGNTVGYKTADFEITAKTDGPTALKLLDPIYQYKIRIEFDDEIQDGATIRWVDGSTTKTSDITTVSGNVATFEFTSASKVIPLGGATITIVGAKDYWGNAAQPPLSFEAVPVADTSRPTITGYGADAEGTIWISFNKKVDAFSAKDFNNYKVINPDGNQAYNWMIEYDATKDDKKVFLKSTGADSKMPGKYKITVKNIKDTVLPAGNAIAETTVEVVVPDTVAPTIVSATWGWTDSIPESSRRIINIYFDEELDYTSAITRANYRTRLPMESFKPLPNNALVELLPGGRTVMLTFPAGFPAGNIEVAVTDAQDLYGNRCNDTKIIGNKIMPGVASTTAIEKKKIEMKFSSPITSFDPSNVRITNLTGVNVPGIAVDNATLSADSAKVTILLTNELTADAKFNGNDIYVYESIPDVGKPALPNLPVYRVNDGIAPSASVDSYFNSSGAYPMTDSFSLYLIFDEKVMKNPAAADWYEVFPSIKIDGNVFINDSQVKDDGYRVEWMIHPLMPIGSTNEYCLRFEFISNATGTPKLKGSEITFTYMAYPGKTIQDIAGNDLGSDGLKDIKFTNVRFGY